MQKPIFAACLILFSTCASATLLFGNAEATTTTPSTALSASDFASRVSALSQQTKSNLKQQATALMPEPSESPAAVPSTTASTTVQPTSVAPTPPAPTSTPSQSYSGFGTGNGTSAPATPNKSSSGSDGFNIKY